MSDNLSSTSTNQSPKRPPINDPTFAFYYDDLLDACNSPQTRKTVYAYIRATIAFIPGIHPLWIIKKQDPRGGMRYEYGPGHGVRKQFRIKMKNETEDDEEHDVKLMAIIDKLSVNNIRYRDIVNIPYRPDEPFVDTKFFNIFAGFKACPAETIDKKLIWPIIRHVKEVWCNDNKELTIYVLNWLAFLVQKPTEKPGTVIVLRSPPRCGKNILTDFIGLKVLGSENFLSTSRLNDVVGRFNKEIQGRKLIVLNECGMTGSEWHSANDHLKSLITEPYVTIERKGIDSKTINDYAGYMILSNHHAPLRVEVGDDRIVALDVSARYKGKKKEYFKPLAEILNHPDTPGQFMAWLLKRDISGWVPKEEDIPNTEMKQELMQEQLSNPKRFIIDYIDIANWPEGDENIRIINCRIFYNLYRQWCDEAGEKKVLSDNKFGIEVKQYATKSRPRTSNGREYMYTLDRKEIIEKFRENFGKNDLLPEKTNPTPTTNSTSSIPEDTDIEFPVECSKTSTPVPKKTPPKVPPKPEHLKIITKNKEIQKPVESEKSSVSDDEVYESSSESEDDDEVYESSPESEDNDEVYDSSGDEMDDKPIPEVKKIDPTPVTKEEPPNGENDFDNLLESILLTEDNENPQDDKSPQNDESPQDDETRDDKSQESDTDEHEPIPEPMVYMDEDIEDMYKNVKSSWERYGNDPEDFDWECFIEEIEDLKNHPQFDYKKDPFHYKLRMSVEYYRSRINGNGRYSATHPTNEEIASKISTYYHEKRGQLYVPPPKEYRTMRLNLDSAIDEKECALAEGDEDFSDDDNDEEWYDELSKMANKKIENKK